MSRFSSLRSLLLRPLLGQQQQQLRQLSISTLIKHSFHSPSKISPTIPLSTLAIPFLSSPNSIGFRSYSSDADLPANMVLVKSEDQLNDSLKKAEDESSPAVFYFTAAWCGPCRFVWPEIKKLSESLPGVKFYKIDIDEVGSGPTLSNLSIFSVPTLHFFKNGKKAAEVVGADSKKIKDVSSSLYKDD